MKWLLYFILFFTDVLFSFPQDRNALLTVSELPWDKKWSTAFGEGHEQQVIKAMLQGLERSKTARTLLEKAQAKAKARGKKLEDFITSGTVSITDSTVVRRFSSKDPTEIEYAHQLKIFLNRDLLIKDAILDLAHELEHFTHRPENNPYEQNKTLLEFVQETIEGEGGEGAAVYKECMIAEEIFGVTHLRNSACLRLKENDSYQWDLVVENFYRVGEYFDEFTKYFRQSEGRQLASDLVTNYFPQLAKKDPVFVSSAYGLPYPIAAIFEYKKIKDTVCRNEQKRLKYLKEVVKKNDLVQRTIASVESRCP